LRVAAEEGDAGAPDAAAPRDRLYQSVKLPPALRRRLRICAALLEKEISELVEEAIGRYLDEVDRQRRAQGLGPIPDG
jgi:hypothetical protein